MSIKDPSPNPVTNLNQVHKALVSVTDKRGIVDLCKGLVAHGVGILSTGGTAQVLRDAGIQVTDVAEFTGSPEILDGRVKTLHPKVHGGLLARATEEHQEQLRSHGMENIDLLVVNLYAFETAESIENIDIGGPAMLRSASKNFERVAVLCDPEDYQTFLDELAANGGATTLALRRRLAGKVFARTAAYDAAIASYFQRTGEDPCLLPERLTLTLRRKQSLRYGENPHQQAAFYQSPIPARASLASAEVLQGKELSYNNLLDLDAALGLVLDIEGPAAVIVKHTNPCGAAMDTVSVERAFLAAKSGDPQSAFGGIVAINREVSEDLAKELGAFFLECVIAKGYSEGARRTLADKRNLRLLRYSDQGEGGETLQSLTIRSVSGGMLVQGVDHLADEIRSANLVTSRAPSEDERRALSFAWKVCKHVKSNAIVLAQATPTGALVVGVGAGQMSRVDSVRLAAHKASERAAGAVLASDAFFPFRDGVDEAIKVGVRAVVQPGGSVKDKEVIAAAEEGGLAMLLTGVRHFRH